MRRFALPVAVLIVVFLCSSTAYSTEKGEIHYGIKAGPNFSTAVAEEGRLNFRTAGAGGAFMSYNLSSRIQVQPEVLFMMRGWKESASGLTLTNKINYVDLNILFKYVSPPRGKFQEAIGIGPYVGMKISNSYDFNIEIPSEIEDAMDVIYDELKSVDFGIVIAGEMNILLENGGMIIFDLRGTFGLTPIFDDITIGSESFNMLDLKNMGVQILVGYAF